MNAASGRFAVTGGNLLLVQLRRAAVKPIHGKSAGNRCCAPLAARLGSFRNPANFQPPPANPRPPRPQALSLRRPATPFQTLRPPEPPPPRPIRCDGAGLDLVRKRPQGCRTKPMLAIPSPSPRPSTSSGQAQGRLREESFVRWCKTDFSARTVGLGMTIRGELAALSNSRPKAKRMIIPQIEATDDPQIRSWRGLAEFARYLRIIISRKAFPADGYYLIP